MADPPPPGRLASLAARRGIRVRITAIAVGVVGVVMTLVFLTLVWALRTQLTSGLDETIEQRADDVTVLLERGVDIAQLSGEDETQVQVVDGAGLIVATSDAATTRPLASPVERGERRSSVDLGGDRLRVLSRAIEVDGRPATLHVAISFEDVDEATAVLLASLVVAVPVVMLTMGALIWVLVGRTLRPMEAVRLEVEAIGGHDLDRRVPVPRGDDEVSRLATMMNAMLDRLERAAEAQTRFVSDAAHELRTPLTRLRTELETLPDDADAPAVLAGLRHEVLSLQHLVDDLLQLARVDAGASEPVTTRIDLDDLVLEEVQAARAASTVSIDVSSVSAAEVVGDRGQLRRIVRNLLDNAVRHALTRVTVTLTEVDGGGRLGFRDDGPGVSPSDRDRVFDRFARLDEARSRDDGGTGLGLAIARELVGRHGGSISIGDGPGGDFVVWLPGFWRGGVVQPDSVNGAIDEPSEKTSSSTEIS